MGIDDAQESRLLSRGMPGDDPTWGEVSAFLENVDSAYADIRTTDLAAGHLAAVSREVRLVRGELQHGRKKTMKDLFTLKTHRILAGSLAAAVIALTAGVGVASAMPGGPLAHLLPASPVELTPTPAPDPATPSATPVASTHESEASEDESEEPEATSTTAPAPKPSARHTEKESEDDSSDSAEARDGEEKDSHADESDSSDDSEEADDSSDSGEDESASSEHKSGGSDESESGDDNGSDNGDGSTDD